MTHERELKGWLQLSLVPGLGAATLRRLLAEFGLPENVVAADRRLLRPHLPPSVIESLDSPEVMQAVDRALAWAREAQHAIVTIADSTYPKRLLETPDPPLLLYCIGRVTLLDRPSLAIVGSRNATPTGIQNAEQFARALSEAGLAIVSGLALGIDAAAHRGGLAGSGSTIAVFGTGIDRIYPRQNQALAERIAESGLLVSEFALQTPSRRENFPRRNRVISGLAQGCLVVEAALASGSLITARSAADQGREVFAIPGSIHSPLAKGCHALIKAGAKLVETADDVLCELNTYRSQAGVDSRSVPKPEGRPQRDDSPLLAHLDFDPVEIDSLCARSGLAAQQVSAELLRLELAGIVATLPGGRYQRLR
ncbi:MAG: DNA protecting protein DprA [Betaproteobacteria bacterium RIFCSPLOWO2_02_FULL_66_14]|nr:MAG: DNA protecting protein DprA [Betaproteobacteria bacterium RIFCSPLOWO2_02_FULL_66_14]